MTFAAVNRGGDGFRSSNAAQKPEFAFYNETSEYNSIFSFWVLCDAK